MSLPEAFMIYDKSGNQSRLVRVPRNEIKKQLAPGETYKKYDYASMGTPGAPVGDPAEGSINDA